MCAIFYCADYRFITQQYHHGKEQLLTTFRKIFHFRNKVKGSSSESSALFPKMDSTNERCNFLSFLLAKSQQIFPNHSCTFHLEQKYTILHQELRDRIWPKTNTASVWLCALRLYQTPITWLRSLSAILTLFWRHGIANFPAFAAKTWEMLLYVMKYMTFSRGIGLMLYKT